MVTALFALTLLALVIHGLERNHRRRLHPRPPLAGSTDIQDRDEERVRAELRAVADRADSEGVTPSRDRGAPMESGRRHESGRA